MRTDYSESGQIGAFCIPKNGSYQHVVPPFGSFSSFRLAQNHKEHEKRVDQFVGSSNWNHTAVWTCGEKLGESHAFALTRSTVSLDLNPSCRGRSRNSGKLFDRNCFVSDFCIVVHPFQSGNLSWFERSCTIGAEICSRSREISTVARSMNEVHRILNGPILCACFKTRDQKGLQTRWSAAIDGCDTYTSKSSRCCTSLGRVVVENGWGLIDKLTENQVRWWQKDKNKAWCVDRTSLQSALRRADLSAALCQEERGDHSIVSRLDIERNESLYQGRVADIRNSPPLQRQLTMRAKL